MPPIEPLFRCLRKQRTRFQGARDTRRNRLELHDEKRVDGPKKTTRGPAEHDELPGHGRTRAKELKNKQDVQNFLLQCRVQIKRYRRCASAAPGALCRHATGVTAPARRWRKSTALDRASTQRTDPTTYVDAEAHPQYGPTRETHRGNNHLRPAPCTRRSSPCPALVLLLLLPLLLLLLLSPCERCCKLWVCSSSDRRHFFPTG